MTRGKTAIVDDEDYHWLKRSKWYCGSDGYARRSIYIETTSSGKRYKTVLMHREILHTPENQQSDHANHDKLDNRKSNLRLCTISQNQQNRAKGEGTSRYRGVSWHKKAQKWQVAIALNGEQKYLGLFTQEKEAALAYDHMAAKLFEEFASTNFEREYS